MTVPRQASEAYPQGLRGQMVCVNTILYCENWADTVAFYKTGLQLPVSVARDWFVEFRLTDTTCLSIADACRTAKNSSRGEGHLITFQVHNLEETRSRLCRNGLAPTPIKTHPWGARVMYLNDPGGNRLEFWC